MTIDDDNAFQSYYWVGIAAYGQENIITLQQETVIIIEQD